MTNWCWSEKWIEICGVKLRPPHHIFFEASCNKHDELYEKGWLEIDRRVADCLFYYYMKQDIKNTKWYIRWYYHIWCYLYFKAVRVWGESNFIYKRKTY